MFAVDSHCPGIVVRYLLASKTQTSQNASYHHWDLLEFHTYRTPLPCLGGHQKSTAAHTPLGPCLWKLVQLPLQPGNRATAQERPADDSRPAIRRTPGATDNLWYPWPCLAEIPARGGAKHSPSCKGNLLIFITHCVPAHTSHLSLNAQSQKVACSHMFISLNVSRFSYTSYRRFRQLTHLYAT